MLVDFPAHLAGWRPISELSFDALYQALGAERGQPIHFRVSDGRTESLIRVEGRPTFSIHRLLDTAQDASRIVRPDKWKAEPDPSGEMVLWVF